MQLLYNSGASLREGRSQSTEKYSRGRRGAPAKGVGRDNRRESSNLSFSAKTEAHRKGVLFRFDRGDLNLSAGLPRERSERDRCQTADKGSARTEKSTSTTKANHCPRSATMILTVRRNALRSQINLSFSANFLYILHFTIFQSNSRKCIKMCQHKNSASCETLFFLRAFLNKNFRYGLLKNNKQREKIPKLSRFGFSLG